MRGGFHGFFEVTLVVEGKNMFMEIRAGLIPDKTSDWLWGISLLELLRAPFPAPDLGQVFSVLVDVLLVLDQLLLELLLQIDALVTGLR